MPYPNTRLRKSSRYREFNPHLRVTPSVVLLDAFIIKKNSARFNPMTHIQTKHNLVFMVFWLRHSKTANAIG